MKKIYKLLFVLLAAGCTLASCSKKKDAQPSSTSSIAAVATNWTTTHWGGEDFDALNFTIDAGTATGTITFIDVDKYGYKVGDKLFTNIKANGDGTFSAKGEYTYGTNNANVTTRDCTLSLQNNNTQLTATYPATGDFDASTVVYQKGTTQVEVL